ncbi:MAG: ribokinase [Anaerolineae bacterium]|nr:ribokinase [Anaerolineae bacterium]
MASAGDGGRTPNRRPIDYLVVGHACQDVTPDGSLVAGGTAIYSSLAASRLGMKTAILTSAAPDYCFLPDAASMAVRSLPSASSTTFENVYTGAGRRQYVRAHAAPIKADDLPPHWRKVRIAHLGPVAQEVDPDLVGVFQGALVGVTPQGWLRQWDASGLVSPCEWRDAERVLTRVDVAILSPEDVGGDHGLIRRYARWARLLVITLGSEGAQVYHRGEVRRFPAFAAEAVDLTGAGDVFATAYLIRYAESRDPFAAAHFANCAAAFVVEGPGVSRLPTRAEVEERLRRGRLRG